MPKQKTKRAAMKRFSKTGTGKLKRWHANHTHILTKKTRKRKNRPEEERSRELGRLPARQPPAPSLRTSHAPR